MMEKGILDKGGKIAAVGVKEKNKTRPQKKKTPVLSSRKSARTKSGQSQQVSQNDDVKVPPTKAKVNKMTFDDVPNPVMPDKKWMDMLFLFLHYRSYGVTPSDRSLMDNKESALTYWIEEQQQRYREFKSKDYAGELSAEVENQLRVLEAMRFPFQTSNSQRHEANLRDIEQFFREHSHCKIPQRSDDGLGKYVNRLRNEYKLPAEKRTFLTESMVERLNKVQFEWAAKKSNDEAWLDSYRELEDYKKDHGDCNVPRRNGKLGKWVSAQRENFKKGKLNGTRIGMLEKIGFTWAI